MHMVGQYLIQINIQIPYWSVTEHSLSLAWYFRFDSGLQFSVYKPEFKLYGWAVRDGDVLAAPLPAAVWLFGSGLLGLIGIARRKAYAEIA